MLPVWIVQSGKKHEHLLKNSTTKIIVRNDLGTPIWSRKYNPEISIDNSEEFLLYKHNKNMRPFIHGVLDDSWGKKSDAIKKKVTHVEVYAHKGPLYNMERGQGYGMIHGMTFGIGGIFLLPMAIKKHYEMARETNYLTFWFDKNGHYVAVFTGNIKSQIENYY